MGEGAGLEKERGVFRVGAGVARRGDEPCILADGGIQARPWEGAGSSARGC